VRNHITWLRASYWIGAVADAIVAAVMLGQAVLALTSPLTHYTSEIPYRYAMGLAGSLMLGWTFLLLWADRRPVDRSGVLMITNIVILGLMGSGLYAVSADFVPIRSMAPLFILQIALIVLFTYSYIASRMAARSEH